MPARQITGKKPKHFWSTFRTLLAYMGRHKFLFLAVAVLVTISALGNLLGTYMIRPVVNGLAEGGVEALVKGVTLTAAIYAAGTHAQLLAGDPIYQEIYASQMKGGEDHGGPSAQR